MCHVMWKSYTCYKPYYNVEICMFKNIGDDDALANVVLPECDGDKSDHVTIKIGFLQSCFRACVKHVPQLLEYETRTYNVDKYEIESYKLTSNFFS